MIINHNMQAMNSHRQMGVNATNQAKSTEKLSSGLRINRAGDDAAGLSISEKMRGQIRGLNQASRNAQDGISLIQTAEGALDEVHSMAQRMRELAVQSANDTNTSADRNAIQAEVNQLAAEINSISSRAQFNGQNLLDGSFNGKIQTGANDGQYMSVKIGGMSAGSLFKASAGAADATVNVKMEGGIETGSAAVSTGLNVRDAASASKAISHIDTAISKVSAQRSQLGAVQNRLEHTIKNVDNSAENLQAAESRIRDVDMAKEMMNFTKTNILNQAAQSMLSQANQLPNQVLSLLR